MYSGYLITLEHFAETTSQKSGQENSSVCATLPDPQPEPESEAENGDEGDNDAMEDGVSGKINPVFSDVRMPHPYPSLQMMRMTTRI